MPALTVHNAEIRTATVEVKTLSMSGKQVTLALFRQLREVELIDRDGRLNGQPWGVVNYHADKCADAAPHLHVVWQSGNALYRDRVDLNVSWPRAFFTKHGAAYLAAKVREGCRDGLDLPSIGRGSPWTTEVQGVQVVVDTPDAAASAVHWRRSVDRFAGLRERLGPDTKTDYYAFKGRGRPDTLAISISAALRASWFTLDEALAELGDEPLMFAEAAFLAEVQAEADRRKRHREVRKALADLPQLFIAV